MADFDIRRRRLLAAIGWASGTTVAGCTGDDEPGDSSDPGDDDPDDRDDRGDADFGDDDDSDPGGDPGSGDSTESSFHIDDLSVTPGPARQTDEITADVTIQNTGDASGTVVCEVTGSGRHSEEPDDLFREEIVVNAGDTETPTLTFERLRPDAYELTIRLRVDEDVVDTAETTVAVEEYPSSFVDVTGTAYTLEEETFYVSGAEPKPPYVTGLTHPNPRELREAVFDGLERTDATVARLHGYSYASVEDGGPFPGGDNEEFFKRLDRTIVAAKRRGIRLSIIIINGAPHYHLDPTDHLGVHVPGFVHEVDGATEIDDFFEHEGCIELYKEWVHELLTRENHLTGVEYRNDPTIMQWELGNELQWEAGWEREAGPSLRPWIEEVGPYVQEVMNGNQLLTTGVHGWPAGRNDFLDDHAPDSITVCSVHWWAPGPLHYADYTDEESAALFDELMETADESLAKPVWIGEYNWGYGDETSPSEVHDDLLATRNAALHDWHDRFDEYDVAGIALHELGVKEIHEDLFGNEGPGSSEVYADAHEGTVAELQRYAKLAQEKSGGTPPREHRSTYYVSPDGDDENIGSEASPLGTITEAVHRAHAGNTIELLPGEHHAEIHTVRSGEPGHPITITGPPDAVWRAHEYTHILFDVAHSHIHVEGITMDGLIDKDRAYETSEAYAGGIVQISPWRTYIDDELEPVDYLEDVVIEPSRMGNCSGNMIFVTRLHGGSIGGFDVIGPAGMDFHPEVEDPTESHVGEIIYVGTTLDDLDERYPWDTLDRSRDIRIHDIDNREGYHHSQFVDLKIGTENITVEQCIDRGSGHVTDVASAAAIELKGNEHTIRWNEIGDCRWGFIFGAWIPPDHGHHADGDEWARDNEVYGNHIYDFSEDAFKFWADPDAQSGPVTPEDQAVLCGNEIDDADGAYEYATGDCGDSVPAE